MYAVWMYILGLIKSDVMTLLISPNDESIRAINTKWKEAGLWKNGTG